MKLRELDGSSIKSKTTNLRVHKTIELTIERWMSEIDSRLNKIVKSTIENKEKLHISAPIGTGKTSFLIEIIKKYHEDYHIIVLEPLIGITTQLNNKLDNKIIPSYIYNYETIENLHKNLRDWRNDISNNIDYDNFYRNEGEEEIVDDSDDLNYVYLSTIDSAWRLIKEGFVKPEKTILLIDESHSFIESVRDNFRKTVDIILDSGCPIIGFSGTASKWVINSLFRFDNTIEIKPSEYPVKTINHIGIRRINEVVAQIIKGNKSQKRIIWIETIIGQEQLKEKIVEKSPELKVVVLNAPKKNANGSEESLVWKHIIEEEEIPNEIDVLIMNKIGQSGININNSDIGSQIMIGKFDPYGFMQYAGRVRNFSGGYYYFYNDYGDDEPIFNHIIDSYLGYIEEAINTKKHFYSKYQEIPQESIEYYYKAKGQYKLDICKYASFLYSKFRRATPNTLIQTIQEADNLGTIKFVALDNLQLSQIQEDIDIELEETRINQYLVVLPTLIKDNYKELIRFVSFYETDMNYDNLEELINSSENTSSDAKRNNKLYIPKTKIEKLRNAIKSFSKARINLSRMLVTASIYSIYKDAGMVEILLKGNYAVHGNTISTLMNALKFYQIDYLKHKRSFDRVVKQFRNRIDACLSADEWKSEIKRCISKPNNNASVNKSILASQGIELEVALFRYMFSTNKTKCKCLSTRTLKKQHKLVGVMSTYEDYVRTTKSSIISKLRG